eukprot:746300-Hanusia_phi.AAC.3
MQGRQRSAEDRHEQEERDGKRGGDTMPGRMSKQAGTSPFPSPSPTRSRRSTRPPEQTLLPASLLTCQLDSCLELRHSQTPRRIPLAPRASSIRFFSDHGRTDEPGGLKRRYAVQQAVGLDAILQPHEKHCTHRSDAAGDREVEGREGKKLVRRRGERRGRGARLGCSFSPARLMIGSKKEVIASICFKTSLTTAVIDLHFALSHSATLPSGPMNLLCSPLVQNS